MTESPVRVRTTDTVREAILLLERLDIRHLPVVDDSGVLVGMLSDRDLRGTLSIGDEPRLPLGTTPVGEVMSREVVRADPEMDLAEIADIMVSHHIGAVPVLDHRGDLVGIVSYVDLLRPLLDAR